MTETVQSQSQTDARAAEAPLSLLLLLIAYYSFIVIGLPGGAFNVAWRYIQHSFDLPLDALGVTLFAGSLGYLFITFTSGPFIARFGLGRFLLVSSVIKGVGLLALALSPNWGVLLLANLVSGVGGGAIDSGVNNYVVANYRASRLNWLHACFGLGSTVGPALVTLIAADMGYAWQWSYVVIAALAFVLTVAFLLTLRRWHLAPAEVEVVGPDGSITSTRQQADVRQTLRMPMLWLSMALFFLFAGLEVGSVQLTNTLFTDARGIDPVVAGVWVSVYWGAFTAGRMLLGGVVDIVGKIRIVRFCLVGATVGAVLISWNPVEAVSYIGLALMGFSISILFPTVLSETPARLGKAHSANAIGLQIGSAGLGIAFVPGLGAFLAERTGLEIIGPFLIVTAVGMTLLHEFVVWRSDRSS